jgi:hypothetical protein
MYESGNGFRPRENGILVTVKNNKDKSGKSKKKSEENNNPQEMVVDFFQEWVS